MRRFALVLSLSSVLAGWLAPPAAWAQQASGLTGIVRDTSGLVMPGVSVEASSPALIEKSRTVVTGSDGRYNIVDLVPGTYTVTFTLSGFRAVRHEGITLTSGFTAQVNADLQVGALEEAVTVTAASPLVDISNTRKQEVASADLLATLPASSKNLQMLVALTPGWTGVADVGGRYLIEPGAFHGKRGSKVSFDGMVVENSDGNSSYQINAATVQEMVAQTSGVSAEVNADGPVMNMVPKDGGNTFETIIAGMFTNYKLESSNLNDTLRSRGFTQGNQTDRLYDESVSVGGPILKDKLWFFTAPRAWGVSKALAGVFWNKTQNDYLTPPDAANKVVVWTPWTDRPLSADSGREEWYYSMYGRLTWQATSNNKFTLLQDYQRACNCFTNNAYSSGSQEAAGASYKFQPNYLTQMSWTSTKTNRLLLEAGAAFNISQWNAFWQPGGVLPSDISINDIGLGIRYGAQAQYRGNPNYTNRFSQRFALSHVTGSNTLKIGSQNDILMTNAQFITNGNVNYTFQNGTPIGITQFNTPYLRHDRGDDFGAYIQDKWVVGRLTLDLGTRFDWYYGWTAPEQTPGDPSSWPGAPQNNAWLGERSYPGVHGIPNWKDINPRVGAAYDLFGNGRTALKVAMGRYVAKTNVDVPAANNPLTTEVASTSRFWTDSNHNFVPDCNLGNFGFQDNTAAGGDICGAIDNQYFGQHNPKAQVWDPSVLDGWGKRDSNWDLSTEVQRQLGQRMSLTAGYYFNTGGYYRNTTTTTKNRVVDNILVTPADYSPYCITAPLDSRLPGGGGYPVCGLYDISPAKFGQSQTVVTQSSNFGQPKYRNHFFDFGLDARLRGGARLGGGVDTGWSLQDTCFVVDSPQQLLNCHVVTPFKAQTQIKLNGSLPLPWKFLVAGVLQNLSGPEYEATYNVPTSVVAQSLGRPLAGGVKTVAVPLVAPNTLFEPRFTRLDLRLTKMFDFGRRRFQLNLDAYNALNSSAILQDYNVFGSSRWLTPTNVIDPRLFQFSGQYTF